MECIETENVTADFCREGRFKNIWRKYFFGVVMDAIHNYWPREESKNEFDSSQT